MCLFENKPHAHVCIQCVNNRMRSLPHSTFHRQMHTHTHTHSHTSLRDRQRWTRSSAEAHRKYMYLIYTSEISPLFRFRFHFQLRLCAPFIRWQQHVFASANIHTINEREMDCNVLSRNQKKFIRYFCLICSHLNVEWSGASSPLLFVSPSFLFSQANGSNTKRDVLQRSRKKREKERERESKRTRTVKYHINILLRLVLCYFLRCLCCHHGSATVWCLFTRSLRIPTCFSLARTLSFHFFQTFLSVDTSFLLSCSIARGNLVFVLTLLSLSYCGFASSCPT